MIALTLAPYSTDTRVCLEDQKTGDRLELEVCSSGGNTRKPSTYDDHVVILIGLCVHVFSDNLLVKESI